MMAHFKAEMAHIHINSKNCNYLLNLSYLKMWSPNWPIFFIFFLFILNNGITFTHKCFIVLESYCINENYGKGYGVIWIDRFGAYIFCYIVGLCCKLYQRLCLRIFTALKNIHLLREGSFKKTYLPHRAK